MLLSWHPIRTLATKVCHSAKQIDWVARCGPNFASGCRMYAGITSRLTPVGKIDVTGILPGFATNYTIPAKHSWGAAVIR